MCLPSRTNECCIVSKFGRLTHANCILRYDTVSERTDQLHRRLNVCLEELSKFRGDSDAFQVRSRPASAP